MSDTAPTAAATPAPTSTAPTGAVAPSPPAPVAASATPGTMATAPAPQPSAPAQAPADSAPAPIKYTGFTLPEGVAKDDAMLGAFTEAAGKMGLPQDQAQAIIDALGPKLAEQIAAPFKQWQTTNDAWVNEVKADPEIGGANFDAMRSTIAKVLDDPHYADPQLRQALDMTGAGNNPAVIRTLYRLAKAVTEGGPTRTGAPAAPPKTAASILYPSA